MHRTGSLSQNYQTLNGNSAKVDKPQSIEKNIEKKKEQAEFINEGALTRGFPGVDTQPYSSRTFCGLNVFSQDHGPNLCFSEMENVFNEVMGVLPVRDFPTGLLIQVHCELSPSFLWIWDGFVSLGAARPGGESLLTMEGVCG